MLVRFWNNYLLVVLIFLQILMNLIQLRSQLEKILSNNKYYLDLMFIVWSFSAGDKFILPTTRNCGIPEFYWIKQS